MSESLSEVCDDTEEDPGDDLPVRRYPGAAKGYVNELAHLFPEFERREDGMRQDLEQLVNILYEMNGEAAMNFIMSFKLLCRDAQELRDLFGLAHNICERWGGRGCEMAAAFEYPNLDLRKFKKAVYVFVNSTSADIQGALQEFWWLLGMTGDYEILSNSEMFEFFLCLITRKGLGACKLLVELLGDKQDQDMNLAWCCREILQTGDDEMARLYRGIPGIETMDAEKREEIMKEAIGYIANNNAAGCRSFLKGKYAN